MKKEDVLSAIYDAEFCEPKQKATLEARLNKVYEEAVAQTGTPLYSLKLAFLKIYPQYRAKRLQAELPTMHQRLRGKPLE